ncbi:MAG TPA: Uma2 family endonuclease [Gemmatimonadales bacterium]|nr:Uma2 family endonuclease [Gemmatimonadales bacterium]
MPEAVHRWTREEVLALPDDGNRYELVNGELLVTPAPRWVHQLGIMALYRRIYPYVTRHRLGQVLVSPADLDLKRGQWVQPDLFVVPPIGGRLPQDWSECGVPILIAEGLSPSTARYVRGVKRTEYLDAGVADYWIVDVDGRVVEHWRPGDERPGMVSTSLEWRPDPSIEPLVIQLPACFAEVWGEG